MCILQESVKILNGAQIVVETLSYLGISTVFGYPGGVVLKLYDELFKQDKIKHYLTRHEQAAIHAAEGFARVSGKCGVVFVTSGPGSLNIVTGLANAYKDGFPVLAITGQVRKSALGKDSFGETDICNITKSITKANFQVTCAKDLQKVILDAYHIAMSGKKGPVLIDIVKDVFFEEAEVSGLQLQNKCETKNEIFNNNFSYDINEVLQSICKASAPVIIAGGGVLQADACAEMYLFSKKLNIPVVNTMMGLGSYPQNDEYYCGMAGLFGIPCANRILKESDLIISVGARFNNRIRCCFKNNELDNKIIQIDINQDSVSKVIPVKFSLTGDAKHILRHLLNGLDTMNFDIPSRKEWFERIKSLKSVNIVYNKKSELLHSFEVLEAVNSFTKQYSPVIVTEVGQHQIWAARIFNSVRAGEFVTAGGLGTMGFGLPASIGASIASPEKTIICIAGDGSLQMNIQELATLKDYNLPVKIMVMNNGYLGMVRQLQEKVCDARFVETRLNNPDFVKLAEAYGIKAFRVENYSQIQPVLDKVFNINEPVLVDFVIEPMEIL